MIEQKQTKNLEQNTTKQTEEREPKIDQGEHRHRETVTHT